jgi:sugar phosphate isomerase/epimerase
MRKNDAMDRRRFLQTGALGAAAIGAAFAMPSTVSADLTRPKMESDLGLKLGVTSYTWRKYPLDQAIELTKDLGLKYISLKDVHLSMKSTAEERKAAHTKVTAAGLTLMGGGVIYMNNNEAEIRNAFDYARDAGMPTIVCSPEPTALDIVEKFAREYKIRIAIHNHGPTDKKYPSPLDVMNLVKDRDPLMGYCIDVGHTVRIKQDPVPIIKKCADRLYEFHMKDVTIAAPNGKPIEVGRGVIDIVAVMKTLLEIKFQYQIALEYEANADNPIPGATGSIAYLRGILATLPPA